MKSAVTILSKFERSQILQVYFARISGRVIAKIPDEFRELYEIDLPVIKKIPDGSASKRKQS